MLLRQSPVPLPSHPSMPRQPPPCPTQTQSVKLHAEKLPAVGALSACERKLAAIATKLVTCPALLLLQQPFQACHLPSDSLAAQHLLSSLQTAAQKLRINIVVGEESLPNRVYKRFPHAVLLDQAGLQVFAGEPQQVTKLT